MKTIKDPRHETRRVVLNKLFAKECGGVETDTKIISDFLEIKNYNQELLDKLLLNYQKNRDFLDEKIKDKIASWSKDQLLDIDLLAIKIAILEFLVLKITPIKVAVDEAVEIAKEFGGEKSGKFVNGVLAKVIKDEKL